MQIITPEIENVDDNSIAMFDMITSDDEFGEDTTNSSDTFRGKFSALLNLVCVKSELRTGDVQYKEGRTDYGSDHSNETIAPGSWFPCCIKRNSNFLLQGNRSKREPTYNKDYDTVKPFRLS